MEDAAFAATSIRLREYVDEQLVKLRKKQEIFRTTGSRYRLLPAALAVSGTLNPADLAETLPALAEKFRQQVEHLMPPCAPWYCLQRLIERRHFSPDLLHSK